MLKYVINVCWINVLISVISDSVQVGITYKTSMGMELKLTVGVKINCFSKNHLFIV